MEASRASAACSSLQLSRVLILVSLTLIHICPVAAAQLVPDALHVPGALQQVSTPFTSALPSTTEAPPHGSPE